MTMTEQLTERQQAAEAKRRAEMQDSLNREWEKNSRTTVLLNEAWAEAGLGPTEAVAGVSNTLWVNVRRGATFTGVGCMSPHATKEMIRAVLDEYHPKFQAQTAWPQRVGVAEYAAQALKDLRNQ